MCNKAVFNSALIVVLWVASVSSVSYFYEKPKTSKDITRHGKTMSYFHFNQEVTEKPSKHMFYREPEIKPDSSELNLYEKPIPFAYSGQEKYIEKPEYVSSTEPTDLLHYGREKHEKMHLSPYKGKPDFSSYKEPKDTQYMSHYKMPGDAYKSNVISYIEQSTPSYRSHIKLSKPESSSRKKATGFSYFDSPKFSERPYVPDSSDYKKSTDFSYFNERQKTAEKLYPTDIREYKKPAEFSYFDHPKLNEKPNKPEFASYDEPNSFSFYDRPKINENPFSSLKESADLSYFSSKKPTYYNHLKGIERPQPNEFNFYKKPEFSYYESKTSYKPDFSSYREPKLSAQLNSYKFLEKPEKTEKPNDIILYDDLNSYKSYKTEYNPFKRPSSSSYLSSPKFVEKPSKPDDMLLYSEPTKYSYLGSSSHKLGDKPFREPSAISLLKSYKTKHSPWKTSPFSVSYSHEPKHHTSIFDEYYKHNYNKNKFQPQVIKEAFTKSSPIHHAQHRPSFDIPKSNRHLSNNDVHKMVSKYANSYFNKQRYNNKYKDYQENANRFQSESHNAEQEVTEKPINEPIPEDNQKKNEKEEKNGSMPAIRVEDLNIQDGEIDNRDLEMMVKIVNNILQVLPYNPE